jgi:uncharacterized protein (DUF4415 family)
MKPKSKFLRNTPAEEAAIQRGIDADPDTFVPTDDQFARMRPAAAAQKPRLRGPHTVVVESDAKWERRTRRPGERGKQVAPTKRLVSLRLSADVLEHYRATGPGWQTRIDETLQRAVKRAARG